MELHKENRNFPEVVPQHRHRHSTAMFTCFSSVQRIFILHNKSTRCQLVTGKDMAKTPPAFHSQKTQYKRLFIYLYFDFANSSFTCHKNERQMYSWRRLCLIRYPGLNPVWIAKKNMKKSNGVFVPEIYHQYANTKHEFVERKLVKSNWSRWEQTM